MKLLLYGYSHETDIIDQPVTLNQALMLIENQQTLSEERDNFIGFQFPNQENCLQFYIETSIDWVVDLPVYSSDVYQYSKAGKTSSRIVKDIVSHLFNSKSRLHNSIKSDNYTEVENLLSTTWKIKLELVD